MDVQPDLPQIGVDRIAFFRCMANLIHNAVKYTKIGTISVRAYAAERVVVFEVADTGPGMAPELVKRLAGFGERASQANGAGGRGIGLWVTARLMKAMGGELSLRTTVGEGSAFSLSFPVVVSDPDASDEVGEVWGSPERADQPLGQLGQGEA